MVLLHLGTASHMTEMFVVQSNRLLAIFKILSAQIENFLPRLTLRAAFSTDRSTCFHDRGGLLQN